MQKGEEGTIRVKNYVKGEVQLALATANMARLEKGLPRLYAGDLICLAVRSLNSDQLLSQDYQPK